MGKKNQHSQKALPAIILLMVASIYSCASIGTPDGGMYDETPPVVVRTTPLPYAVNSKEKKITIEFDEYIKLENPNEKVIVSPMQLEAPEIKVSGKKVVVELMDTLKPNTTYTIDFADAIVDNNEGNPLGDFAFAFSTGEAVDTMQVSGTVLDASNLEPVKGILVGLYSNLEDSAFTKLPLERVARTDSRGRFVIRGIAADKDYRIYALQDVNQSSTFDQKSEMIAFTDRLIRPTCEPALRPDTLWIDTLTIDTIRQIPYTRFMPDDIVLRAFKETPVTQYMVKNERLLPTKFSFYFSVPADTLPTVEGLNFNATDAFIIEHTAHNDTVHYWIKDSLVYNLDTLALRVSYLYTDTLAQLVPRTDTLEMAAKTNREKLQKEAEKKLEDWKKDLKKKLKRGDVAEGDTLPPIEFLKIKLNPTSTLDLDKNLTLSFDEPLVKFDTAAIRLEHKVDSLWEPIPYIIEKDELTQRDFTFYAEWRPEQEYRLTADSLAFIGLYGKWSNKLEQNLKVASLDDYSALFLHINGADASAVVQLLDSKDAPVKEARVENGRADLYFLKPGTYYLRLFNDRNGNGVWNTGLYADKLQPEEVFYFTQPLELKARWEIEQDWDLNTVPAEKQKPEAITKQKPEAEKQTARSRNIERLKKLGR